MPRFESFVYPVALQSFRKSSRFDRPPASNIPVDVNACFNSASATVVRTMIFQPVVNFLQTTFGAALRKLSELGHLVFRQVKYTCNAIELSYAWILLFPVPQGCSRYTGSRARTNTARWCSTYRPSARRCITPRSLIQRRARPICPRGKRLLIKTPRLLRPRRGRALGSASRPVNSALRVQSCAIPQTLAKNSKSSECNVEPLLPPSTASARARSFRAIPERGNPTPVRKCTVPDSRKSCAINAK
jgi:hypothetical protein